MLDWLQNVWVFMKGINMAQVESWLQEFSNLGPLPGILLPFIEAFFPALPLIVLVMGNAAAYGLWLGFLYSWIGVCLGAICVFWIFRFFGKRLSMFIKKKMPGTQKFFNWIGEKGFTPMFLLFCFPFTPSVLVTAAAGLSGVAFSTFIVAVLTGKSVMIFMMAFIGHDWQSFIHQPWRILIAILVLVLLWLGGKKLEQRYHHQEPTTTKK
jgi:uncharacterized membrane protein YdjX (TVP38/TMEM64 family)